MAPHMPPDVDLAPVTAATKRRIAGPLRARRLRRVRRTRGWLVRMTPAARPGPRDSAPGRARPRDRVLGGRLEVPAGQRLTPRYFSKFMSLGSRDVQAARASSHRGWAVIGD